MRKKFFIILAIFSLCLTGCAALTSLLPSQLDQSGNSIAGTHTASAPIQAAAGSIPGGSLALNGLLLVWNLIEQYNARKTKKGLTSTLQAINKIKADPVIGQNWENIKAVLSDAHEVAQVKPFIQSILTTLKK